MKKISIPEFKDYYTKHSFNKIIFASINQSFACTSSFELVFKKIIVSFNPDIICFTGQGNMLYLSNIKTIKLHNTNKCLLGDIFTVVCADLKNDTGSKEYTFVIR